MSNSVETGPVVFKKNETGWTELTRSRTGPISKDIQRRGERLRVLAIRQVGKKTGHLAGSIRVRMFDTNDGPMAWVGSDDKIALLHHEGSRPHPIAAKPGRMLRFAHRGKIVYARKVMHPGTRPNRYLYDNLRRVVVD